GRLVEDARPILDAAAFGIGRAVVEPPYPGKGNGLGTHRAGLERDVEIALDQSRGAERLGRLTDRQQPGLRGRTAIGLAAVARFGRDGWRKLNQELGLTGMPIPEAYGGQGFGFGELAIVLEEMGRSLLCAPYFSTTLAATAILNAGREEQKKALLPGLADGTVTATFAFQEENGSMDPSGIALTATGSKLNG